MTDHDTAPGPMSAEPAAIDAILQSAKSAIAWIGHQVYRGYSDDVTFTAYHISLGQIRAIEKALAALSAATAERDAAQRHFETACSEIDRLENEDEKAKRIVELEKALNECNAYDAPAEVIALRSERDAVRARLVEVEAHGLTDRDREDIDYITEVWSKVPVVNRNVVALSKTVDELLAILKRLDAAPSGTTGGGA